MYNTFKQKNKKTIFLNKIEYKGYELGSLPPSFGFIEEKLDETDYKTGICEWFNYKGLTYIAK